MARAAAKKKKKKEKTEFERIMKNIWAGVDKVLETGKDFSLDQAMAEYEELGIRAEEEREGKEQLLKELKPRKDLRIIVARKAEEREKSGLPRHMTPAAIMAAINLAEIFEAARKPKDLKLKKWVKKEVVA